MPDLAGVFDEHWTYDDQRKKKLDLTKFQRYTVTETKLSEEALFLTVKQKLSEEALSLTVKHSQLEETAIVKCCGVW